MEQVLCVLKVVFHHVLAVVFHRIRAGAFMENDVNLFMVKHAIQDCLAKGNFIHVVHNLQTLDIFEFNHIGQVIHHKDIIPAPFIQTFYNITADKFTILLPINPAPPVTIIIITIRLSANNTANTNIDF